MNEIIENYISELREERRKCTSKLMYGYFTGKIELISSGKLVGLYEAALMDDDTLFCGSI